MKGSKEIIFMEDPGYMTCVMHFGQIFFLRGIISKTILKPTFAPIKAIYYIHGQ